MRSIKIPPIPGKLLAVDLRARINPSIESVVPNHGRSDETAEAYYKRRMEEERQQERQAVEDFIAALQNGNVDQIWGAGARLEFSVWGFGWRGLMRRALYLRRLPKRSRRAFLDVWLHYGDHLREECGHDLILTDGLRAIMPRYYGCGLTLYRGEGAENRRRRTYGLSWSASIEVAESFAMGQWRASKGRSVLLRVQAPAAAIICKITHGGEREYVVDRRRLGRVDVLKRFSHVDSATLVELGRANPQA